MMHNTNTRHTWDVAVVGCRPGMNNNQSDLITFLAEGWEPFAVTWDGKVYDYHLRRLSDHI